ncbi:carbohydrate kinase family protein [Candidatus Bathycorpusculum sp.]|uniref:carbohydrate kinase family protein n=1 Tax=Candidatus Bathycorpusculum sp. TaxID=2994959 RepID=UPI00282598B3|nr:carbohydrate kinase family protein [Candidatus Termitimicrobium sp.]
MSLDGYVQELQVFLKKTQHLDDCRVVVMPDFFLDRLVDLEGSFGEFAGSIEQVVGRRGGSIDGVAQIDQRGGNALNVAFALSRLDVLVTPIICTSEYGLELIKYYFKNTKIDLSHVKTLGKASITTALEFRGQNEKINVMLRDVGALADFGPSALDEQDYALIADGNYVCLFNWVGTKNYGTALAQAVFGHTKKSRGKTYYDTADPTPNKANITELIEKVLKSNQIDILSLNENEAITYAGILEADFKNKQTQHHTNANYALEAARILSHYCSARIDLHTSTFSASLRGHQEEVVVPTFRIDVLRATGAGDAWNAGNILADFNGLSDKCRLLLANAVSACYLLDANGVHPTKEQVAGFLKSVSYR